MNQLDYQTLNSYTIENWFYSGLNFFILFRKSIEKFASPAGKSLPTYVLADISYKYTFIFIINKVTLLYRLSL